MSTETKLTALNSLFSVLSEYTLHVPKEQLLTELQIAIERISFSGIANKSSASTREIVADLDILFGEEISTDTMNFLHWLARKNALSIMSDKMGRLFLSYCMKQYETIREIRFVTAIDLSQTMRQIIAQKLRYRYTTPVRIVYEVVPTLIAGFVIKDGSQTIDRSLRTHMFEVVKSYIIDHTQVKKGVI